MTEVRLSTFSQATSPQPTGAEVRFLVIGRIIGPVGVTGVVRARLLTDFPERFNRLTTIQLGDNLRPHRVESVKVEGDTVDLKLAGVEDAVAARALRDQEIHIPVEQAIDLPINQFYWHQIIGLRVRTDTGRALGKVTDVLRTGSNDVYVVGRGGDEILVPAIEDAVLSIDLDAGTMLVHLMPGLEDPAE
jgi:16S rRNA processing protein RimM